MLYVQRSVATLTGLLILAASLVSLPAAPSIAVPPDGKDSPPVELVEGTPRSVHVFEPGADPAEKVQGAGARTEGAVLRSAPIQVKLVIAKLADNKGLVDLVAAKQAVAAASNYWSSMSANRISMTVTSELIGHQSQAMSTWQYGDIVTQITAELNWSYSPNTALVVFIPSSALSGGALGAGYSSSGNSGRILMPQIGSYTNSVIAHEFGHVLGSMHADSLQCGSGASDVGTTSQGLFVDSSCSIREYGDTTDLMGASRAGVSPVISSSLWEYLGLGSGSDVRDLGVAAGVKSYTLKPWGGKDAYRAVKFTDPISTEVYYLELRQPVGYDSYLSASEHAGNRGVKVVQRGGSTAVSSLALTPSTKPFSGFYNSNHAWQAGSSFTTHAGTRVNIEEVSAGSATVTIVADPALMTKVQFSVGDFSGDGRPDLISRESNGLLVLNPGQPGNRVGAPLQIGSGWNTFNTVGGSGDFDGDKFADIIARTSQGALWLYPGNGSGGFLPARQIGTGWQSFQTIVPAGDFDGDGRRDLLGILVTGALWLYPGDGAGGFLPSKQVGSGWHIFTRVASASGLAAGVPGLVARAGDGTLYLYPGNGIGGFKPSVVLSTGSDASSDLVGGQDFTADGSTDLLLARSNGALELNPGDGSGRFAGRLAIGTGWNQMGDVWEGGDFDGDGRADIMARNPSGTLILYSGNGSGSFLGARTVGVGWQQFSQVISAGNFDGKGGPDLVARTADGMLWLYTTDGTGRFTSSRQIGNGWGGFKRILSPGDFNGDGRSDIVAQSLEGDLWLYPGNGAGGFLAPKKIGIGWNGFSQVIAGNDFNGDGKSDIMARSDDGNLWLYAGNGTAGFLAPQQIGTGWGNFGFIASVGRFSGTVSPNVVGVDSDGRLWLYTGTGSAGFQSTVLNPR